ncbi:SH3 domain-containing protein [Roseovarius aestuariivivens]|uniref:SH3 domain-containing protein n=1 Tax=Roseovarius aestuariivivens TaxID=1888910 RepID=UPI0010815737|nr:SH3 domain-containing protein [Roseovarius aestuariivivens]
MIRAYLCICFLILGSGLRAEPLPAFYDVTDVAETDVLNIRSEPRIGGSIIGTLAADATDVEVVAYDDSGEWGRINTQERAGWVALRFLSRQAGQPGDALPRPLRCIGNEPFWSLSLAEDSSAEFLRPGQAAVAFGNLYTVVAENRTDRYAIFAEAEARVLTAVFRRAQCTDTMSDRAYGIDVDIFLTEQSGVSFVSGCCSLAR